MSPPRSFLGTGWSFPIASSAGGAGTAGPIAFASDDQKVSQSIWMILTTTPGERMMRPDFGCNLSRLVFSSLSSATIGQVINEVQSALSRWEPRIDVLSVDAAPSEGEANLLLIDIDYVVRSTNSRFNLVYPFYLS